MPPPGHGLEEDNYLTTHMKYEQSKLKFIPFSRQFVTHLISELDSLC